MLMDEPFGAIDPIVRARLQDEFMRLQREVRKTVVFVTHDIDEAIKLGDRIAILREGGRLAQYDTPAAILAQPADDFVAQFVGHDRALKALTLRRARGAGAAAGRDGGRRAAHSRGRDAARRARAAHRAQERTSSSSSDDGRRAARRGRARSDLLAMIARGPGPVIPNFGHGSECEVNNGWFCTDWVRSTGTTRWAGARRSTSSWRCSRSRSAS